MSIEFLDHTADAAVRIRARDAAELFQDATLALLSLYLGESGTVACFVRESIAVSLEAENGEALLIDYLNELIFLFDTRRFLTRRIDFSTLFLGPPCRLEGLARGETLDLARHEPQTEIKAATFHGLEIRQTNGGVEADVVFDL